MDRFSAFSTLPLRRPNLDFFLGVYLLLPLLRLASSPLHIVGPPSPLILLTVWTCFLNTRRRDLLPQERHPVLNLSQASLPVQVIGPIPQPPNSTGKPLQAHHNPSLCAHRNRCLHLAAICIISIMAVINIGNSISVMPLDCAMRATPTPGTSTPTSHRALRDRGPRDYFTLGHNNLTVTSSVNR